MGDTALSQDNTNFSPENYPFSDTWVEVVSNLESFSTPPWTLTLDPSTKVGRLVFEGQDPVLSTTKKFTWLPIPSYYTLGFTSIRSGDLEFSINLVGSRISPSGRRHSLVRQLHSGARHLSVHTATIRESDRVALGDQHPVLEVGARLLVL